MKNKTILLVTVLFSLMLVGIVLVQIDWVNRVMRLNQNAFDEAVYKALAAVVKEVEEKENFVFIKRQIETDSQLKKTRKFLKDHAVQVKKRKTRLPGGANNVHVSVTGAPGRETKTVVRIEKDNNGNKTTYNSVFVGSAAIDSFPVPPAPPLTPSFQFITTEDKKENIELILEKMLSVDDPDSVTIKPADVEKMLAIQLKQNNLPQRFTFALLAKDPAKSYVKGDTSSARWRPYKINLYPNDLFGREVTLALMFPVDETSVNFDMWGPAGLSLFFITALLVLFVYSIRMLLRHKKMLAMKNDFINHMSHEFKTPLAGISLGADMLMGKPAQMNAGDIQKVASVIKKQSVRLTKEVNDVLQNALLEENLARPHTLFNLVEVIKTQLELLQPQIAARSAQIHTDFSSEIILVKGNESQWHKVISNLVDNSLKFSRENPEINISVRTAGQKICVRVSDNGMGIASKDLGRIFDKFFRADYYKQSNIQGFGLGLNFVKTVVETHKGTIKAESGLNAGTSIIIEIDAES